MFVVSIMDRGDERNFLATELRLNDDMAFVDCGGVTHVFKVVDVIDIIPVSSDRKIDQRCLNRGRWYIN